MLDWDRIENFIGFGRPDAPVVFLGMEEGLLREADLLTDLQRRSTFEPYMDLSQAQAELGGPGRYFGRAPITQKTWRPICDLMLRRAGVRHPTREQRLRYQADHLGRQTGETLLTELLPYPHSDANQWLYAQFGRYSNRQDYADAMIRRRQELLSRVFRAHPPQLIVAHGKQNWEHYKAIFRETTWDADGPFEQGYWEKTRLVLAHQLSGRQFNSDVQLQRFADLALDGSRHQ